MKILFLNHHVDAQHKMSARLQSVGAVLLIPAHIDEAWKMIQLHGASLDLAIIHREGEAQNANEEGETLIARIKADATQADLPIILTSSLWNETDFFQHQQGPMGVNAYLRWPFDDDQLIETIETMFGNSIRFAASTITGTNPGLAPSTSIGTREVTSPGALPELSAMSVMLEESSDSGIETPAQELKFEAPPALEIPGSNSEQPGLSLDPPLELGVPGDAGASQNSALSLVAESPGLSLGLGSLAEPDLNQIMSEDLEPHERLELDLQLKTAAEASPQHVAAQAAGHEQDVEAGTMVLDPETIGLRPIETQQSQSSQPNIVEEEELASELPYLFPKKKPGESPTQASSALVFTEAVGDAVIPGGAVQSPDLETLKKYLMLREQDVAILSNQLKAARAQAVSLEKKLREESGKGGDLEHALGAHQKRIEEFEKEKALALQGLHAEIEELRFQNRTKADKARLLESKVNEATDEIERLKERVRNDIRKIRVREKELENKLEIVRKDSEALITSRETKIMELKRKIDLLEFNIDLLQDQNAREKENSAQLRERLAKAAQVVRVAGGLLDSQGNAVVPGVPGVDGTSTEKKSTREAS